MSEVRTLHFDMHARTGASHAPRHSTRAHKAHKAHVVHRASKGVARAALYAAPHARQGARVLALPVIFPFIIVRRTGVVPFMLGVAVMLGIAYIGLIATVMSYASLTVGFAQSVRDDEATVAMLEAQYLDSVKEVTSVDYASLGYEKPARERFVAKAPVTALR